MRWIIAFLFVKRNKMIAILTDFGNSEYLGIMKGVIYSICQNAKITDLYNNITPQNIKEGAWILLNNYKFFPKNTIFLCVVDPGVGSERNSLAIKTKNYFFIGPDNGLMYLAITDDKIEKAVKLSEKGALLTFHGRDVFAKAAAMLENKKNIEELGEKTSIKEKLIFHLDKRNGEVVRIDCFGNIITNLPPLEAEEYEITSGKIKKRLRFYKTYADAPDNELFLITGSNNTLEISIKNKKANKKLRLKPGDKIEIR